MAELKTKPTGKPVSAFLNAVTDDQKRKDSKTIAALMKKITGSSPKMWGDAIVGFGSVKYRYDSGRENDWFLAGFSPRKQNLVLYLSGLKKQDALLKKLGKVKAGGSCLYINKLDDVNLTVLEKLIGESVKDMKKRWS